MPSTTQIEISNLQNKLQSIYWRVFVYIIIWTSVISALFILKSLLIFYLIPITNMTFITFMLAPETNSVEDTIIGSFYETILSLLSMMISFALMMIATKAEKLYIQSLGELKDPQAFLFTLEISRVPNNSSARFMTAIFDSLQGPTIKENQESIVQEVTCVYNLENYFENSTQKRFINFNSHNTLNMTPNHTQTNSKIITRDNKSESVQVSKHLILNLYDAQYDFFNGKMLVVLRDLEVVYDILNLYHCGLLETKIQTDVDSALKMGLLGLKKNQILDALNQADKNSLFQNLKIKIAPDAHDIIWNYYCKSDKEKKRENRIKIIVCVVIAVLTSLLMGGIYYVSTKEFLNLKFVDSSKGWKFNAFGFEIFMNWITLLSIPAMLILPFIGSLLIEFFADSMQCDYYSDYNNLRFRLEIMFEFILRYIFLHWGFTFAVNNFKESIPDNKINDVYDYIVIEWNKIAFLMIPTTISRYLIKYFKGWIEKCSKRATPENIRFSIDHSIASVNILLTFMYLGFYFPVLSFSIVLLLTFNLIINFILYYCIYRNTKILRDYLSYSNISMLINHCLVAFNIGGILSIFIFANFSSVYFKGIKEYTGALPSNFIGSIFMLLFAFINYMTNKPNSLYLRVLQNLITVPTYKEINSGVLKEALKQCDYQKNNPYYKELNRINPQKKSINEILSSMQSDEKEALNLYSGSISNHYFDGRRSNALGLNNAGGKFNGMLAFGKKFEDAERKNVNDSKSGDKQ
jgi:hypothetical protein